LSKRKGKPFRGGWALILGGFLRVIDHEKFDRGFLRFQFEAELFLNGGENVYAV
jgi:hypothetical protein